MTRREALEKRIRELRGELQVAWSRNMPVVRMRALRDYLASAWKELQELERAERKAAALDGSGPVEGPGKPTGGQG